MGWFYIVIVLLMRIVQNVFVKTNSKLVPKNSVCYLKYTIFYIGCASIPAFVLFLIGYVGRGGVLYFDETLFYATLSGVALAIGCCCSLYALTTGTMVLNSLFATAGLLVPTIAGVFLYQELLSIWQYVAIVIFMLGAYFLVGNSKTIYGKFSFTTLVVLIVNLLSNGITMLMQTMFARNVENGNVSLFSFLSFISGAVVLALVLFVILIIVKNSDDKVENNNDIFALLPNKKGQLALPKKVFLGALILAVAVFVINQLITISASTISPVTLFSFTCGGATIISAVVGSIMYKEKFTTKSIIGIILGVGSLIMIKIFTV